MVCDTRWINQASIAWAHFLGKEQLFCENAVLGRIIKLRLNSIMEWFKGSNHPAKIGCQIIIKIQASFRLNQRATPRITRSSCWAFKQANQVVRIAIKNLFMNKWINILCVYLSNMNSIIYMNFFNNIKNFAGVPLGVFSLSMLICQWTYWL